MNSWNIFGHNWAVELLRGHLVHHSLRHAFLITGPSGVGRRTLAIRLAQALHCQSLLEAAVPCGICRPCKQVQAGQHIDLMVIQAEKEGGTLKVEQVREARKFLSLKPHHSAYKVVLLLRFEEANPNAANALLKTLEEAPSYGLLLLTASSAEQLLPTIVSRCEIIRLRPASIQATQSFLESHHIPAEKARLLAHLSDGRPGFALRLATDENALGFRAEKLDDLNRLLSASLRERFKYAETFAKDREAMRRSLFLWLSWWRDALLCAAGTSAALTNIDQAQAIRAVAGQISLAEARKITRALDEAIEKLEKNVNPRLLAEVTLMNWPRLHEPAKFAQLP